MMTSWPSKRKALGRRTAWERPVRTTGAHDLTGAGTALGPVVHCCAPDVPFALLRGAGARALALDLSLLDTAGWEAVAAGVEDGLALWAGLTIDAATNAPPASIGDLISPLVRSWKDVGLAPAGLAHVTLTPACGLAAVMPQEARRAQALVREAARALTETAAA